MSDDAVCASAEHPVGHFVVGRDPAPGVRPPAELGECDVEAPDEGGQHDLGVELPDSLLRFCHQAPHRGSTSTALYHIWVIIRKWIAVARARFQLGPLSASCFLSRT